MGNRDELVRVYTGTEITCLNLIAELENAGVRALLMNDFQAAVRAGYGIGTPSSLDVLIPESSLEKAGVIIEDFIKNNPV